VDIGGLDAAGSMAEMLTMARMLSPLPLRRSRLESCERNDGHDDNVDYDDEEDDDDA